MKSKKKSRKKRHFPPLKYNEVPHHNIALYYSKYWNSNNTKSIETHHKWFFIDLAVTSYVFRELSFFYESDSCCVLFCLFDLVCLLFICYEHDFLFLHAEQLQLQCCYYVALLATRLFFYYTETIPASISLVIQNNVTTINVL